MSNLDLIKQRHSVRCFLAESIQEPVRNRLRSEVTYINSHEAGLNFQLSFNDPKPFEGFRRSYGMFRNVRNYLAAVIDPTFDHAAERAGFYAEQFAIECTRLGIGTCFVGGTFSRSDLASRVEVYEKVPFVVAFGMPDEKHTSVIGKLTAKVAKRKSRPIREFFDGSDEDYTQSCRKFPWLPEGLKAISLAPSALNSQPVRIKVEDIDGETRITAHTIDPKKYAVELGIAKYNFSAVIGGIWDWGENGAFYPDI